MDGNDFDEIDEEFNTLENSKGTQSVIIAKTIKGKRASFMKNNAV